MGSACSSTTAGAGRFVGWRIEQAGAKRAAFSTRSTTPAGRQTAGSSLLWRETRLEAGQCAAPFAILALDAETLQAEQIYLGGPGTPSGAGTVAAMLNDGTLLVGTFAGDRIVRVAPVTTALDYD
jgi:hypothetical protein